MQPLTEYNFRSVAKKEAERQQAASICDREAFADAMAEAFAPQLSREVSLRIFDDVFAAFIMDNWMMNLRGALR